MSTGLTVKWSGIAVLNFSIIVKYHFSFPFACVYCLPFFKSYLQSERKAWFYLAQNFRFSVSKTFKILFRKNDLFLESIFFHKYRKKQLSTFVKSLKNNMNMNFFTGVFLYFFYFLGTPI